MSELRLPPEQLEALAALVVEQLRPATLPASLVGVKAVAEYLDVKPGWVNAHADELGVRRLGKGPKAPLRFSLPEVDERLSACYVSRGSSAPDPAPQQASRRRRSRRSGTSVDLLPVRGQPVAVERGAA